MVSTRRQVWIGRSVSGLVDSAFAQAFVTLVMTGYTSKDELQTRRRPKAAL